MTDRIDWSTPPSPDRGAPSKHNEFWDALKQRPNEWAIFKKGIKGSYTGYARAHTDFAFCTRTVNGEKICYAKYIGDGKLGSDERGQNEE